MQYSGDINLCWHIFGNHILVHAWISYFLNFALNSICLTWFYYSCFVHFSVLVVQIWLFPIISDIYSEFLCNWWISFCPLNRIIFGKWVILVHVALVPKYIMIELVIATQNYWLIMMILRALRYGTLSLFRYGNSIAFYGCLLIGSAACFSKHGMCNAFERVMSCIS